MLFIVCFLCWLSFFFFFYSIEAAEPGMSLVCQWLMNERVGAKLMRHDR